MCLAWGQALAGDSTDLQGISRFDVVSIELKIEWSCLVEAFARTKGKATKPCKRLKVPRGQTLKEFRKRIIW